MTSAAVSSLCAAFGASGAFAAGALAADAALGSGAFGSSPANETSHSSDRSISLAGFTDIVGAFASVGESVDFAAGTAAFSAAGAAGTDAAGACQKSPEGLVATADGAGAYAISAAVAAEDPPIASVAGAAF